MSSVCSYYFVVSVQISRTYIPGIRVSVFSRGSARSLVAQY